MANKDDIQIRFGHTYVKEVRRVIDDNNTVKYNGERYKVKCREGIFHINVSHTPTEKFMVQAGDIRREITALKNKIRFNSYWGRGTARRQEARQQIQRLERKLDRLATKYAAYNTNQLHPDNGKRMKAWVRRMKREIRKRRQMGMGPAASTLRLVRKAERIKAKLAAK